MKCFRNPYLTADTGTGAGGGNAGAGGGGGAAVGGGVAPADDAAKEKDAAEPPAADPPEMKYSEADFAKLKTDHEAQITKAVEEALKKAQMQPAEKAQYETDQRLADIERKEKEIAAKELRFNAMDMMAKKKVDLDFLDYILSDSLESTEKRMDDFKKLFDKKVQESHVASFAGETPAANNGANAKETMVDEVKKALGGF